MNSCSHSGMSEHNGSPRSVVVSSLFGFGVLVGLGVLVIGFTANNKFHRSIINI